MKDTKNSRNDTDMGKPKYSGINQSHCHFIHHRSHTDQPGIESSDMTNKFRFK